MKLKGVLMPVPNASEAAVVTGLDIIPVRNLHEAADFLTGNIVIAPHRVDLDALFLEHAGYDAAYSPKPLSFLEIRPQKRASTTRPA